MPDISISDFFNFVFGRSPSDPAEALLLLDIYDRAAVAAGLPKAKWTPTGMVVSDDIIALMQGDEATFDKATYTPASMTAQQYADMLRSAIRETFADESAALDSMRTRLPTRMITDAELGVLDKKQFAAAAKFRSENNGQNPSVLQLQRELQPGLSRDKAETAYFSALRTAGLWPPKSEEYQQELIKRFGDIWGAIGRGDLGDIPDAAALIQLIGENLPEPEAEFTAKFKEQSLIKEKFGEAWQRLLSTKGIEVPAELQDSVKAQLGKAYVDAAYRNPASTKAESIITGGIQNAVEQAKGQQREESQAATLAQLVQEGDYDRASRLVGPPPMPKVGAETPERPLEFANERITQLEEATAEAEPLTAQDASLLEEQKNDIRQQGALGQLGRDVSGARVVSATGFARSQFDKLISEQTDPGYQTYLQKYFAGGERNQPYLDLSEQFQAAQTRLEGALAGPNYSDFIQKEFEKLLPEFPGYQKQQRAVLAKEESQARSFRSGLLTRHR